MLSSISIFVNNGAALEKMLRLTQSLAQIVGGLSVSSDDAAPWFLARSQLALSRRYFRLFKWIDCWSTAQVLLYSGEADALHTLLAVSKWSLLGMYFFLEMFTITNAIGATNTAWGPRLLLESNKFWFYGIAVSILLSLYELLIPSRQSQSAVQESEKDKNSRQNKTSKASRDKQQKPGKKTLERRNGEIYKQLIIDACDISIPGSFVGWIQASQVTVGLAMSISSALAARDIWVKLHSSN